VNRGFVYREIIDGRGAGRSLLPYLAERYPHSSPAQWGERIASGAVLVDGEASSPEALLRPGQSVLWARPPWEEPAVPLVYALLYEDGDLVAVAKPSGLPTLPGGGFLDHTLLALVRQRFHGASPAHRLGRGTSGVVLFARTAPAAAALAGLWRERRVTKVYRALVEGSPERDAFAVEVPIGPVPHPTLGTVHAASPSGKASRSEVRVLERRRGTTLVEVRIETGRPHQIRIHMAACGHPLVGDPLYVSGGGPRRDDGRPGDTGYLLHALRLDLPHPTTGAPLVLTCAPPRLLRPPAETVPRS